jgi:release factor glutamine methyltransferase
VNVDRLLRQARAALSGNPAGRLEAELLLCHVLGVSRSWLYANRDQAVTRQQGETFLKAAGRRAAGEPLAYITGSREFWSLSLKINEAVLIPRPETELLVETALQFIPEHAEWRIADLGTGSGAIALALATERPACEVHATDVSEAALALARDNASRLNLSRVRFHAGSWLEGLSGRFHLIVSNPPYIAGDDVHLQQGDCRFEPVVALTPGADGMEAIRTIATESRRFLLEGGMLAFEHGYDQGEPCRALLEQLGYRNVTTRRDLAGLERVTSGLFR